MAVAVSFISNPTSSQALQIKSLYELEGWWGPPVPDEEKFIRQIVSGSYCFAVVMIDQTLAGMGRAISDGISDAYIQDVVVSPDFRGSGIGKQIIQSLSDHLVDAGISWVGLIAEKNSHGFYETSGFSRMPGAMPMKLSKY